MLSLWVLPALAADFAAKPVTLTVPWSPGRSTEVTLRVLAFVLGPLMENNLRKSLIIALFLLGSPFIPYLRKKREEIPKEEIT